ncbi:MAG TPA: hypothetical protein VGR89_09910 [Puia sp.]|nr:hypothetical protein [Puia sp.]
MEIEKMVAVIDGKEYSFSVEVMHDDESTIYRVTPDQPDCLLCDVSPGYLEYDGKGIVQLADNTLNDRDKLVSAAIGDALMKQLVPHSAGSSPPATRRANKY